MQQKERDTNRSNPQNYYVKLQHGHEATKHKIQMQEKTYFHIYTDTQLAIFV